MTTERDLVVELSSVYIRFGNKQILFLFFYITFSFYSFYMVYNIWVLMMWRVLALRAPIRYVAYFLSSLSTLKPLKPPKQGLVWVLKMDVKKKKDKIIVVAAKRSGLAWNCFTYHGPQLSGLDRPAFNASFLFSFFFFLFWQDHTIWACKFNANKVKKVCIHRRENHLFIWKYVSRRSKLRQIGEGRIPQSLCYSYILKISASFWPISKLSIIHVLEVYLLFLDSAQKNNLSLKYYCRFLLDPVVVWLCSTRCNQPSKDESLSTKFDFTWGKRRKGIHSPCMG